MNLSDLRNKIKENRFLIIGRAGIDIYPEPPGTKTERAKNFVSHLGGSSANIAVALTKLGGKCHLLTCISDDALGRLVINHLNNFKVDSSLIRLVKGDVRLSFAVVESTIKDHQSIIYRNSAADLFMNTDDVIKIDYSQFSCLIVTGTCLASEPSRAAIFEAFNLAKKNGLPIFLDLDYRAYTWGSTEEAATIYLKAAKECDVVIGNDEEFGLMAGNYKDGFKLAKELINSSSIIAYKKGKNGSIAFVENETIKTGVFNVKALKPTGAGDAFIGAFIGSMLNNKSVKESFEYGSAAAAIVVTKVGCSSAMPYQEDLYDFLKNNKISSYKEI